jgi:lysophospholipase L1-like esterase
MGHGGRLVETRRRVDAGFAPGWTRQAEPLHKYRMRLASAALALVLATAPPARAADQIVTLGDSLSFAYEGEFGFQIVLPPLLGGTTYGDNMPATVRNWIETLSSPAYRSSAFDQGGRISVQLNLTFFGGANYQLFLRNRYNWAIPGLTVDQLRQFVLGEKTFLEILADTEDFALLGDALALSTFNEGTDFNVSEMDAQIASSAERLILFIGGNDLRAIYGNLYNGDPAGSFEDDFIADATAILDRVRLLNPDIQLVVAAVPHIGITPDIQSLYPTDPVKTGRVTTLLRRLNSRLKDLAAAKGGGFADVFTPTLPLLAGATYGIHGIAFHNAGSATGDLDFLWLNGPFSANFHPNTNGQAIIANAIVDAFNERYDSGIAPLSATEILGGLLGKSAAQIDMSFPAWSAGFGLAGLTDTDDRDGDGIPAGVEFATGLNPTLADGDRIRHRANLGPAPVFELSFPRRLPLSTRFTLAATSAASLDAGFAPVAAVAGADGLLRATLPVSTRGFLRLESTLAP